MANLPHPQGWVAGCSWELLHMFMQGQEEQARTRWCAS